MAAISPASASTTTVCSAGPDDFGTYFDYDNPPVSDTANLKPYFAAETTYVVAGGETCSDGYNPANNCSSVAGGTADIELQPAASRARARSTCWPDA